MEQPVRDTTSAESDIRAKIAELDHRIQADEPEPVQLHEPGVICFGSNGAYLGVSPDIPIMWPLIARPLEYLLGVLPARHRLEYVQRRIEMGATLALAYLSPDRSYVIDAGVMGPEWDDDGKAMVAAYVCTTSQLDLDHTSKIAESIALRIGAHSVRLWTPFPAPLVAGYRLENYWPGRFQAAQVRPIQ